MPVISLTVSRVRAPALLCLAALLPDLAWAACPTAADMEDGVEITFANGDVTVMRAIGAGMVEVEETYSWSPEGRRYFAWLGLYVTDEGPLVAEGESPPEARVRTVYPVAVTEMPVPAADAPGWEGTLRREIGSELSEAAGYQVRFGRMAPVTMGGCTYDAVAIGESLRPGTPEQKDQYSHYLPALGTGYIVGWTIGGELFLTEPVAIRALGPHGGG